MFFFFMKIIALMIQKHRTSKKLVTQNSSRWKEAFSQLFRKSNCTDTFEQSPTMHGYFGARQIFYLTIWRPKAQAFQNTFLFDQYLFNSRSNFHMDWVHWNSLHPKRPFYLLFLKGKTPHFLCENHKTRSNNQHHQKAGFVAVILSLRVGVKHIQKVVQ